MENEFVYNVKFAAVLWSAIFGAGCLMFAIGVLILNKINNDKNQD